MKQMVLLSLFLCVGACSRAPIDISKSEQFTAADTEHITRMALGYIVKEMPPEICLKEQFGTVRIETRTAGILHIDPAQKLEKIPENWFPKGLRLCGKGNANNPNIQIGRPSFARIHFKNIGPIDVADVGILFRCGSGHLCSETGTLSYSRKSMSKWKEEEYIRNSIGM